MEILADRPTPSLITPTIGRRIWYWPSDFDRGIRDYATNTSIMEAYDTRQPCDAGIVYVHSDRCVNLSVTDHNGKQHARTSVVLVQPCDPIPTGTAYATWMDYHLQPKTAD